VWTWYISLSEYGLALPVIFFIGPMADRIGRKPLLLWNTTVMFISFILKTLVVYKQMPLYYYLIASGVEGLSGTVYGFNLINHTILADTTTTGKDRSFMMTVYDALIGVGAVCSNIATGYIIELLGYTYVYIIATGMLFLIPIVIKTTLNDPWKPSGNKSTLTIAKLPGQTFSLCCNKQLINSKMFFFILYLLILSLGIFPYSSVSGIRTLYLIGPPFCWTSEHIGWFGAGSDFLKYIGGTGILKIIHVLCVRLKDEIIVVLGLVSSVASLVLLGFSNSDWMVYGGKYIYVY
jgi:MFS family permease